LYAATKGLLKQEKYSTINDDLSPKDKEQIIVCPNPVKDKLSFLLMELL
jgi:hypothetical protein